MPESKSKRKQKRRSAKPQPAQTPPKRRRTPKWVPYVFFGSMGIGVVVIILNYMQVFGDFHNWLLFVGLGLMAVGFGVSTRLY